MKAPIKTPVFVLGQVKNHALVSRLIELEPKRIVRLGLSKFEIKAQDKIPADKVGVVHHRIAAIVFTGNFQGQRLVLDGRIKRASLTAIVKIEPTQVIA